MHESPRWRHKTGGVDDDDDDNIFPVFFSINAYGVWFYILTPIVNYIYGVWWLQDETTRLGFIWKCWYPFDKHQTLNHSFVYFFEALVGELVIIP